VSALPPPVARYREFALRDGPRHIETVDIETVAWMRRPGMPRLPLRIRMAHRIGHEFVHDIRVGRGPLAVRFGLDAYLAGHGVVRVGQSVDSGPTFDQSALIAMWGEALAFPSAWEGRDDVRWESLGDSTARLVVVGPDGEIPITVGFHRGSGCPIAIEADRHKGSGAKVRWRGTSTEWRRWPGGVIAPARYRAQWADERYPWIDIRTRSLRVNVPIDGALRLGTLATGSVRAISPS
jgi:hypothetical protein